MYIRDYNAKEKKRPSCRRLGRVDSDVRTSGGRREAATDVAAAAAGVLAGGSAGGRACGAARGQPRGRGLGRRAARLEVVDPPGVVPVHDGPDLHRVGQLESADGQGSARNPFRAALAPPPAYTPAQRGSTVRAKQGAATLETEAEAATEAAPTCCPLRPPSTPSPSPPRRRRRRPAAGPRPAAPPRGSPWAARGRGHPGRDAKRERGPPARRGAARRGVGPRGARHRGDACNLGCKFQAEMRRSLLASAGIGPAGRRRRSGEKPAASWRAGEGSRCGGLRRRGRGREGGGGGG